MAAPGTGLRFDAMGRASPDGYTVTNVPSVASTAVRLIATATASAGIPNRPVSGNCHASPDPNAP